MPAEPSFSADETATTSAALAIMARLTYDSSRSSTVIPISGWRLQTPRISTSARTECSASTVAAPTSACAPLSSVPPSTVTSTLGCSASATAIGGLFVITVASQVGRKVARDLERRRAGVEQDHLPVAQQAGGRARDRGLRRRCLLAPHGVGPRPDRGRQRAAVHPPHAPGLGKLLEVAPDRVERDVERRR